MTTKKLINIGDYYINKDNIRYFKTETDIPSNEVWRVTYHITIYFDKEHFLTINTNNVDLYYKWVDQLL